MKGITEIDILHNLTKMMVHVLSVYPDAKVSFSLHGEQLSEKYGSMTIDVSVPRGAKIRSIRKKFDFYPVRMATDPGGWCNAFQISIISAIAKELSGTSAMFDIIEAANEETK